MKKKNKTKIKEFKNWHNSAVVHGFLPTFPTSLLPTLLFSDSDTSVYIRTSLLPPHWIQAVATIMSQPWWLQWDTSTRQRQMPAVFIPPPCELPPTWSLFFFLLTFTYSCWNSSHMPSVTYILWKVEYTFSGKPNMTFSLTKANRIILQNKNVDTGHFVFLWCFCHF